MPDADLWPPHGTRTHRYVHSRTHENVCILICQACSHSQRLYCHGVVMGLCEKGTPSVHMVCTVALQSTVNHLPGAGPCCRHLCVGCTWISQTGSLIPLCDAQESSILREAVSPKSLQTLADLTSPYTHSHSYTHIIIIITLTQSEGHI